MIILVKSRDNLTDQGELYAEAKNDKPLGKNHSWTEAIKPVKSREKSAWVCYAYGIQRV